MISKWDSRFLSLTNEISSWSKDSFKVGAIIVKDNRILSTGYNGFPVGFSDTKSRILNKELKRIYMIHAEENCILNAVRNDVNINNSTLYVNVFPCLNCCIKIIQSGIVKIVTNNIDFNSEKAIRYKFKEAVNLLNECNVKLIIK